MFPSGTVDVIWIRIFCSRDRWVRVALGDIKGVFQPKSFCDCGLYTPHHPENVFGAVLLKVSCTQGCTAVVKPL